MDVQITKSFRKTLSMTVKNWKVIVKAPFFMTKNNIHDFIENHKSWIDKRLENEKKSIIDHSKISDYKKRAKEYIPSRVESIAKKYWYEYNTIKITSAKTRWGSCTSKKNLNFSYRLILCPNEVIDYVICHELSHLTHMNHSKLFWQEVEKMMPDFKIQDKWLKDNWSIF